MNYGLLALYAINAMGIVSAAYNRKGFFATLIGTTITLTLTWWALGWHIDPFVSLEFCK